MKISQAAVFALLSALSASAAPVLPRQTSETDYTGYTLEGCNNMFDVCKGHLVHPGHVPGGMAQCQFELKKCTDTVAKAVAVVPRQAEEVCTD
ncbi:hypothetical protein QBC34DRAFT_60562 [Podospora aff. communis PSN243]|uniref:Uncharacterized protein n=1 Tax=Podospora aff. communis PSN243 TaxID=3040156 RepID=A0AAV9GRD1_9PEZI|nr:hypothetical protein QBC34DRAFT_60562 [Podospora aff. communis PSN243]